MYVELPPHARKVVDPLAPAAPHPPPPSAPTTFGVCAQVDGATPVYMACLHGHAHVLAALMACGASVLPAEVGGPLDSLRFDPVHIPWWPWVESLVVALPSPPPNPIFPGMDVRGCGVCCPYLFFVSARRARALSAVRR
jgi:hypothetical protein